MGDLPNYIFQFQFGSKPYITIYNQGYWFPTVTWNNARFVELHSGDHGFDFINQILAPIRDAAREAGTDYDSTQFSFLKYNFSISDGGEIRENEVKMRILYSYNQDKFTVQISGNGYGQGSTLYYDWANYQYWTHEKNDWWFFYKPLRIGTDDPSDSAMTSPTRLFPGKVQQFSITYGACDIYRLKRGGAVGLATTDGLPIGTGYLLSLHTSGYPQPYYRDPSGWDSVDDNIIPTELWTLPKTNVFTHSTSYITNGSWKDGEGTPAVDPDEPPVDPYPPIVPPIEPPYVPEVPEPIPIPDLPPIDGMGFITLYCPSMATMGILVGEMFANSALSAIKTYFADPMDIFVGLMLLPFSPTVGSSYKPKIGTFTFNTAMPVVTERWYELNCGTIHVNPQYGAAFDFSPYTQISLWLPYIGYVDLNVDEVMDEDVTVKYHIDCLTGDCVAFILVTTTPGIGPGIPYVIAQYSGNCGVQMPFAKTSYDSVIQNSISMLTTIGVAAATGGVGAAALGAGMKGIELTEKEQRRAEISKIKSNANFVSQTAGQIIGGVADVISSKPRMARNGSCGSSNGLMGIQTPYLITTCPRLCIPDDYGEMKGYPCNQTTSLSQLSGFVIVDNIKLNSVPATQGEINEIYGLLKGGVYI